MAKLLEYAKSLAKEGEAFDKNGEEEEAIPQYIKVVDILLLLAEAAPTYPEWCNYISKAEFYQKRTKIMLAKVSLKNQKNDEGIPAQASINSSKAVPISKPQISS